jgi:hypothetical protein
MEVKALSMNSIQSQKLSTKPQRFQAWFGRLFMKKHTWWIFGLIFGFLSLGLLISMEFPYSYYKKWCTRYSCFLKCIINDFGKDGSQFYKDFIQYIASHYNKDIKDNNDYAKKCATELTKILLHTLLDNIPIRQK